MSSCATIRHLEAVAAEADDVSLARAATHALRMISDIDDPKHAPVLVECLGDLVETIYEEQGVHLIRHVAEGAADCEFCAALMRRLRGGGHTGHSPSRS
jgi:hypothetical protein